MKADKNLQTNLEKPTISIVSPVYNEACVLPEFLEQIQNAIFPLTNKYDFEIIWVDDGSKDNSKEVIKELINNNSSLILIELRRNYGQTAALQAGLDKAIGEIIISLDADLQHFPDEIPKFIQKLEEGFDVVCGWRKERNEGIIRRWPSKLANALIRFVSGLSIHDIGTTYRAYRSEIIHDFQLLGENHRFVPVFAHMAGASIQEIPIKNIPRPTGKSNYGLSRTLNVFLDIIFLYFYVRYFDRPIRLFGRLGLLFIGIGSIISSVLLIIYALYDIPVVREHSGWFILSMILLLTGTQVILFGILNETIMRVYFKPGERTHYRVRQEWKSSNNP